MRGVTALVYAIFSTGLFFVIISKSFFGVSDLAFLIICLVLGIFCAFVFRNLKPEASWERMTMVYLPAANLSIVIGMIDDNFNWLLNIFINRFGSIGREAPSLLYSLTNFVGPRMVFLELILITIGVLGPLLALHLYKKEKIPWMQTLFNIIIVIVIYLLALLIEYLVHLRIIQTLSVVL